MDYNHITNDIAIDFGSSNTRIYIKDRGLVLNEPSVVAYDTINGEIVAFGSEAYAMLGRTPSSVAAIFPLRGGIICDATLAEELLKCFLRSVCQKTVIKPRIIMSIPCSATDVERRALRDAAIIAGARKVYIMDAPIAAAIGANCDVSLSRGMMVADLGGGKCDFATISLGQISSFFSDKSSSGFEFTNAIIEYLRQRYSLLVGFQTAERLKIQLGCVTPRERTENMTVAGLDISSGLPSEIYISSEDIREAVNTVMNNLTDSIKTALSEAPSSLLGDIIEDGILLTGGLSKIYGIARRLRTDTEIKVFTAQENDMCVLRGLAAAIENIDRISKDSYALYQG